MSLAAKVFSFSYVIIDTIALYLRRFLWRICCLPGRRIILSGNDLPALVGTAEQKSTVLLLMRDGKLYDLTLRLIQTGRGIISLVNRISSGAYDIEIIFSGCRRGKIYC